MTDEERETERRLLEFVKSAEAPELVDLIAKVPADAAIRALKALLPQD